MFAHEKKKSKNYIWWLFQVVVSVHAKSKEFKVRNKVSIPYNIKTVQVAKRKRQIEET